MHESPSNVQRVDVHRALLVIAELNVFIFVITVGRRYWVFVGSVVLSKLLFCDLNWS